MMLGPEVKIPIIIKVAPWRDLLEEFADPCSRKDLVARIKT